MKTRLRLLLAPVIAAAVIGTATIAFASPPANSSASPQHDSTRQTEQRTKRFIEAFNEHDYTTLGALVDTNARMVNRLPLDGAQDPGPGYLGREQVVGYFRAIHQAMPVTTMIDLRISVTAGGRSSFVQFDGDFTTADGRPYRNVYIMRVDWEHGRMTTIEEYANPVTFCRAFPTTPTCPT